MTPREDDSRRSCLATQADDAADRVVDGLHQVTQPAQHEEHHDPGDDVIPVQVRMMFLFLLVR
jgi:hypothetical protein